VARPRSEVSAQDAASTLALVPVSHDT
jgi:hypothetical protein